ncbi:hypothetical protein BGZ73_009071 [Actinomortierella ambigua]|nr:hypothetical protein BGZ73_009071 [Actinomortierella ambigua]
MAACYSSGATAPLHGLANAMLGESSFAAKSSTFSSAPSKSASNGLHSRYQQHPSTLAPHLRHGAHHHNHQLHPLSPVIRSPPIPAAHPLDSFEQAWSQTAQQHHPAPADLIDPSEGYHQFAQLQHHHHYRHAPFEQAHPHRPFQLAPSPSEQHNHQNDPLLQGTFDKAWQQHTAAVSETMAITPAAHVQSATAGQNQAHPFQPATLPVTAANNTTLLSDFHNFVYQPEITPATLTASDGGSRHDTQEEASLDRAWSHATTASSWAEELQQQQQQQQQEDTNSEDEFSQDWSNEAFTAAYIAANQAHFDQIQARDDEREQRRLEVQERENQQKRRTGHGHLAPAIHTRDCTCTGQASSMAALGGPADQDEQHLLLYKEFMRFNKDPTSPSLLASTEDYRHGQGCHHGHHHQGKQQSSTWASEFTSTFTTSDTPIRHADGFESMTTDIEDAAMLYHPAARSRDDPRDPTESQPTAPPALLPHDGESDAWAREFASSSTQSSVIDSSSLHSSAQSQQRAPEWHRYLGEWNWQAMFAKPTHATNMTHPDSANDHVHTMGELRDAKGSEELALEHQRLQAVALSRLAALFGHLSMQTGGSK